MPKTIPSVGRHAYLRIPVKLWQLLQRIVVGLVRSSLSQKKSSAVGGILVAFTLFLMIFGTVFLHFQKTIYASDTLNFQARLLTNSGSIAPDGVYNVEFKLYDQESGGTELWTETRLTTDSSDLQVTVRSGYLSVYLGDKTGFPSSIDWNDQLYLTMNIGGTSGTPAWDGEMTPRIRLTSVPFAFQADRANVATELEDRQGSNTGSLRFGALTNDRNILLPNSSGTVALLQTAQTFTGAITFSASGTALTVTNSAIIGGNLTVDGNTLRVDSSTSRVGVGTTSPDARLTVTGGADEVQLRVGANGVQTSDIFQITGSSNNVLAGFNSLGQLFLRDSGFRATLETTTLTGDRSYILPDVGGTFCLTSGNCSGVGGQVGGTGTAGRIAMFTGVSDIDDSFLFQDTDGIIIDAGRNLTVHTDTLFVDSTTGRVGIGTTSPDYKLDVQAGTGIVAQFSGRVVGGEAVNSNEFVTLAQLESAVGATGAYVQGGNEFGETAVLGTTDSYGLQFVTNAQARITIANDGDVTIANALSVGGELSVTNAATFSSTLTVADTLTVTAGGMNVTGDSVVDGTLTGLTGLSSSGDIEFASLNAGGMVYADEITGQLRIATAGTDYEVPLTFQNGLVRTGSSIALGGSLTEDTELDLDGHDLAFTGGRIGVGVATPQASLHVAGPEFSIVDPPFLIDTFTNTDGTLLHNHSPDTGGSWEEMDFRLSTGGAPLTSIEIDSNNANQPGTSVGAAQRNTADPGTEEYDIEAEIRVSSGTNRMAGFAARMDSSGTASADVDRYEFFLKGDAGDEEWVIRKVVNGSGTTLASAPADPSHIGEWLDVRVEIRHSYKRIILVDGSTETVLVSTTDNEITDGGRVGIGLGRGARVNNLVVAPPSEPSSTFLLTRDNNEDTKAIDVRDGMQTTFSITHGGQLTSQAGATFQGSLGIGTDSPAYALDVQTSDAIAARFSGRVIGADAVNANEFVTLGQLESATGVVGSAFLQGGNEFDEIAVLGTTDAYGLNLITDGTTRLAISAVGNITLADDVLYIDAVNDRVQIGSDADIDARLSVIGGADQTQLLVRAHATQTSPLVLLQDSTGGELARLNATDSSLYLGFEAGGSTASGDNNIGIGASALGAVSTGAANTTLGSGALASVSIGSNNTAVGYNAGNLLTGSNNILLGYEAGSNIEDGSNNIIIGYNLGASSPNVSNELRIGGILQGNLDTLELTFNGDVIVAGELTIQNGLVVTAGGIDVTGDSTIDGTLDVTGEATFDDGVVVTDGGIDVTGDSTITGNLGVDGNFQILGTGTFTSGTGAITLQGDTEITGANTFTVGTGATTLGGSLQVDGQTTFNDTITIDAGTGIVATFSGRVSGADAVNANEFVTLGQLESATGVVGSAFLQGGNTFEETAVLGTTDNEDLQFITNNQVRLTVTAGGDITIANALAVGGTLTVTGAATFEDGLTVTAGGADITGDVSITGELSVTGQTTFEDAITINAGTGIVASFSGRVSGGAAVEQDEFTTLAQLQSAVGAVNAFLQGGNAYEETAVLGTTDNYDLQFITNNETRLTIANDGDITIANALSVGGQLTVVSGGANITGDVSITGELSVTGATTFTDIITIDAGTGLVASFSGRVSGADAVNANEFATLGQVSGATANVFTQQGNSFGDLAVLGTTDNYGLQFITNNEVRLSINHDGSLSSVQIGDGLDTSGSSTLLTLDRSDGPPVTDDDAYLGSMYYDTTIGRIQCYEAGGWGSCGSPPDNIVNLDPEYAGAVLNGSGIGTMTADFCANESGVLSVNSSLCEEGEALNFYRWASPQATQQTYSIYITYQLPSTFDGFASDETVQLTARRDNSNAEVSYEMFRNQNGQITQCGTETVVTTADNVWQTVGINGDESTDCGFTAASANGYVIFKINMKASNNASAYSSTLSFTTTGR